MRYNSLENPIGIETGGRRSSARDGSRYNSLENPIGIETRSSRSLCQNSDKLQLIRKPDRDWNLEDPADNPAPVRYNSLENPIGIETAAKGFVKHNTVAVTTH